MPAALPALNGPGVGTTGHHGGAPAPAYHGREERIGRAARGQGGRVRLSGMVTAVDAHAGGEPGRVIVGGVLDVPGRPMFEKRLYLERHADRLRKRMLCEPRGYPGLCCNVIRSEEHTSELQSRQYLVCCLLLEK